jgi:hypothetical protein
MAWITRGFAKCECNSTQIGIFPCLHTGCVAGTIQLVERPSLNLRKASMTLTLRAASAILSRMLVISLFGFSVQVSLATENAAIDTDGFVKLFNGKNLDGWVVEGTKTYKDGESEKPIWTVEDGLIQCAGKGFGFLRYDKEFCDFEYRVEFRMTPKCNSGVGIRHVKFTGPADSRPSRSGYEIQLLDDAGKEPSTKSTGSLYRFVAPKSIPLKPVGEWNEIVIECKGPRIKITLNGEQVQDVDQTTVKDIKDKPLCGYVSVQNHGGKVAFRSIRLKELK